MIEYEPGKILLVADHTYSLDGAAVTMLTHLGGGALRLAHDPQRNRAVALMPVFDNFIFNEFDYSTNTWQQGSASIQPPCTTNPCNRPGAITDCLWTALPSLAYSSLGTTLTLGGVFFYSTTTSATCRENDYRTHVWDGSAWNLITGPPPPWNTLSPPLITYNSRRTEVLFCGALTTGVPPRQTIHTWAYNPQTAIWTPYDPPEPHPPAARGIGLVYDRLCDLSLLLTASTSGPPYSHEAWVFDAEYTDAAGHSGRWYQVQGFVYGRRVLALAYDSLRDRVVAITEERDFWQWSLPPRRVASYPDCDGIDHELHHNGSFNGGCALGVGVALHFRGTDYMRVPNMSALNPKLGEMSLMAWVRLEDLPPGKRHTLISKRVAGRGYELYARRPLVGSTQFVFVAGVDSCVIGVTPAEKLWFHLAAIVDSTHLRLYFNGRLTDVEPRTGALIEDLGADVDLFVGRQPSPRGNFAVGTIDEIQLFNRAITAEEVLQAFARSPNTVPISDTWGLWGLWFGLVWIALGLSRRRARV